jgi:hypothetical protein
MPFNNISPEEFRRNDEATIYKSIILNHFSKCMVLGTCANGKAGLIAFEKAIKMLEAAIVHRISEDYQEQLKKIVEQFSHYIEENNEGGVFEMLRLRFMLLVQEMSFLGYMPEERAMDVV